MKIVVQRIIKNELASQNTFQDGMRKTSNYQYYSCLVNLVNPGLRFMGQGVIIFNGDLTVQLSGVWVSLRIWGSGFSHTSVFVEVQDGRALLFLFFASKTQSFGQMLPETF